MNVFHPECGRDHLVYPAQVRLICRLGVWLGFIRCGGQVAHVYARELHGVFA
jgi:hypothetical protein